ncbi:hypothetical protein E4U53_005281 [Claviceps sorghi]|nr:hypothetical protein E4U53_005281 [Claviceps sorghi]
MACLLDGLVKNSRSPPSLFSIGTMPSRTQLSFVEFSYSPTKSHHGSRHCEETVSRGVCSSNEVARLSLTSKTSVSSSTARSIRVSSARTFAEQVVSVVKWFGAADRWMRNDVKRV